jgi:hypothetical protein
MRRQHRGGCGGPLLSSSPRWIRLRPAKLAAVAWWIRKVLAISRLTAFGMLVIIQPGMTPELGAALDRARALRVAQIRPRFDPGGQAINGGAMLCGDGAKGEKP